MWERGERLYLSPQSATSLAEEKAHTEEIMSN